jgi:hypothetical protein
MKEKESPAGSFSYPWKSAGSAEITDLEERL